ncbi:MAG TPA: hypothetical protein GXZ98_03185 [Firmicutes bacterium]|nr:hypothetical protein [Bacillota bacterium]
MAKEIWQQLTSAEEEADRLIDEAKQEAAAYLAAQRKTLATEEELILATARKEGKAEQEKIRSEAEEKAASLLRTVDQEIKVLRSKAAERVPAVVDFIKERIRG